MASQANRVARRSSRSPAPVSWQGSWEQVGAIPGAAIISVSCRQPAGPWSDGYVPTDTYLVLPRRGGFRRRLLGREQYVDPTTAYFDDPAHEREVMHPRDDGDDCTLVSLSADAVVRFTGDGVLHDGLIPTSAEVDMQHRALVAELRRGIDTFELEERLATLIAGLIARALPGRLTTAREQTETTRRRLADEAREAIAADPAGLGLRELAAALGYSHFHVSRVFRQVTGITLTQHRNRIRVAAALDRLTAGERNLAGLASDLGFADQSHMCRVMRNAVGRPPSLIRRLLAEHGRMANRGDRQGRGLAHRHAMPYGHTDIVRQPGERRSDLSMDRSIT
jgi:AraC-like DNA-binding protein